MTSATVRKDSNLMRKPRGMWAVGAAGASVTALLLTGCGSDNGAAKTAAGTTPVSCTSGTVTAAGSTFQQNIEQQWAADFATSCSGSKVTYTGTGSGAGIQQFGAGTIAFAGSDVPMTTDEQAAANRRCGGSAVTLPVTAGGIAVIYHVRGVSDLRLSAKTLAGIFQGTIKHWNDAPLAADNPGVHLPSLPIVTYHRADGSGTTSVFSAFETALSGGAWHLGTGKTLNWPAGQGANGSDGVVRGVTSTNGSITYAEASYAMAHNLPTAAIQNSSGAFVKLTTDAVQQAIASGFTLASASGDAAGALDFTKMQAYPLSTVSYAIVCHHYSDPTTDAVIRAYLGYALGSGQSSAAALGYAPLPATLVADARRALSSSG